MSVLPPLLPQPAASEGLVIERVQGIFGLQRTDFSFSTLEILHFTDLITRQQDSPLEHRRSPAPLMGKFCPWLLAAGLSDWHHFYIGNNSLNQLFSAQNGQNISKLSK